MVPDAAILLVGLTNRASEALAGQYVVQSSFSLVHLGRPRERCRKKRHWDAANLTCVNSPGLAFGYGAGVWDVWIGGIKWEGA